MEGKRAMQYMDWMRKASSMFFKEWFLSILSGTRPWNPDRLATTNYITSSSGQSLWNT